MGGEQLEILEQRIEKAIKLIEELKGREKKFAEEKKILEERIKELTNEIEAKDDLINELKNSQRFLKEKIEVILDKLESIEIIEATSDLSPTEAVAGKTEDVQGFFAGSFSETKIIEDDRVVDLNEVSESDESEDNNSSAGLSEKVDNEVPNEALNRETEVSSEKIEDVADENKESIKNVNENDAFSNNELNEKNVSENKSVEPEEDLKIIDGGKSLFEDDGYDGIKKGVSNIDNEKTGESFLFNTKSKENELENDSKWFKNNPFI